MPMHRSPSSAPRLTMKMGLKPISKRCPSWSMRASPRRTPRSPRSARSVAPTPCATAPRQASFRTQTHTQRSFSPMAKPLRRGRPPASQKALSPKPQNEAESEAPKTKAATPVAVRKPRSSVAGGNLKLHAPDRPGFRRRFVNDTGNRIAELQELGYTLVEDSAIATHGPGSRINRLAGTQDGGAPLKTFL